MRVGILTFHWAYNYGAVLQAWGLHRALGEMGVDSEFINYVPSALRHMAHTGWGLRTRRFLALRQKRAKFRRFRADHLPDTPPCPTLEAVSRRAKEYSAVISGSDQIWNSTLLRGYDPTFYLDFPLAVTTRRVSYAASCGQARQRPDALAPAGHALQRIDHLSVRDSVTCRFVRERTGINAPVVADPTVLTDFLGSNVPPHIPKDFILAYFVDVQQRQASSLAGLVRKSLGIPVIGLSVYADFHNADYVISSAGVEEWLALFQRARFVLSDSFHGTIFAMKNRKPFFTLGVPGGKSQRLEDLLGRYGASQRLVPSADEVTEELIAAPIQYDIVHAQMASHRRDSLAFLRNAMDR